MRNTVFLHLVVISLLGLCCFSLTPRNEPKLVMGINNSQILTPPARWGHDMIYDPVNQKIILFGGYGTSGILDDLWIYDYQEKSWIELYPVNNPPARHSHKLAYCPENQKIILFGGYGRNNALNDMWSYDYSANNWQELNPENSPSPRMSHAMAYDSFNNKLILFSGYGVNADTWVFDYDSNLWVEKFPTDHPTSRYGHTFIYDSYSQLCILFGGPDDDTWSYNYTSEIWSEMNPSLHPCSRYWHMMTYDTVNYRTILFGGSSLSVDLADTWLYDYSTNNWLNQDPESTPPPRSCAALAYDSINQKVILFGGSTEGVQRIYNDTWVYDYSLNKWFQNMSSNNQYSSNTETTSSNILEQSTPIHFSLEILIFLILIKKRRSNGRMQYKIN